MNSRKDLLELKIKIREDKIKILLGFISFVDLQDMLKELKEYKCELKYLEEYKHHYGTF